MGTPYAAVKMTTQDQPRPGTTYAEVYQAELERIADILSDYPDPEDVPHFHHVGSTSVPGLPAIPSLDIVADVDESAIDHGGFVALGYSRAMKATLGHPVWLLNWTGKGDQPPRLLCALHVTGSKTGAHFRQRAILVRDILRSQPRWLTYYRSMREALLEKNPGCYQTCKGQFFSYLWAFHNPGAEVGTKGEPSK